MRDTWCRPLLVVAVIGVVSSFGITSAAAQSTAGSSAETDAAAAPTADVSSMSQVLGVVTAGGGSYDGKRLTLTGVEPDFTWFSDRPQRSAGLLPIAGLSKAFFARQSPPNAALVIAGAPRSRDVVVVEVSKPRYDAERRELSFVAKQLETDDVFAAVHPRLSQLAARADAKIPGRFGKAAMFVDTAPVPTETADQALAAQLGAQYAQLQQDYGRIFIQLKACIDKYKTTPYFNLQEAVVLRFQSFLTLHNELEAIQTAVASTGTFDPTQQQQISDIQAAVAPNQQFTTAIEQNVAGMNC